MGFAIITGCFLVGILIGFVLVYAPYAWKKHAPKDRHFSRREMDEVNNALDTSPASTNADYSRQLPYIKD